MGDLKIIDKPVNELVVVELEGLLEDARKGKIASIGCAVVSTSGTVGRHYAGGKDIPALIGAVCWLKRDLLNMWRPE